MYSCMHFDDILIEKGRSVELHVHFCTFFFIYIHVQQKDKENEDTFIIYQKLAINQKAVYDKVKVLFIQHI